MTLEEALDIVMTEVERLNQGCSPTGDHVKALELVEDAVLSYMKIEKWISAKDELNGKASIVIEDGNVRAES
jgi:hypothetical protein